MVKHDIRRRRGFGRCLRLENGKAELWVTLDIGPRVIYYGLAGGKNFFFEDKNKLVLENGPAFDKYYGAGAYWRTYGGHRMWLTPEVMPGTYYPDNSRVTYREEDGGFVFTPPPQAENSVQHELYVKLDDEGTGVTIENRATNLSSEAKAFGVWSITVMCSGGLALCPQNTDDTGLLHNREMSFWPYADLRDSRFYLGGSLYTLKQSRSAGSAFKTGAQNRRGFAAYLVHGAMFVKEFPFIPGGSYPDGGCNFETYTNPLFLELESLGEIRPVVPGETVASGERWRIVPGVACPGRRDEAALEAVISEHIGR